MCVHLLLFDPIEWEGMSRGVVITELASQIESPKELRGQQWVFSFWDPSLLIKLPCPDAWQVVWGGVFLLDTSSLTRLHAPRIQECGWMGAGISSGTLIIIRMDIIIVLARDEPLLDDRAYAQARLRRPSEGFMWHLAPWLLAPKDAEILLKRAWGDCHHLRETRSWLSSYPTS